MRNDGSHLREIIGKRVSDVMGDLYNQVNPQLDAAFAGEQVDFELTVPARLALRIETVIGLCITYKPLKSPGEGAGHGGRY